MAARGCAASPAQGWLFVLQAFELPRQLDPPAVDT